MLNKVLNSLSLSKVVGYSDSNEFHTFCIAKIVRLKVTEKMACICYSSHHDQGQKMLAAFCLLVSRLLHTLFFLMCFFTLIVS